MRKGTLTLLGALLISGLLLADDGRKSLLTPPEGSALPEARGIVELERHKFELKAEHLAAATEYGVFLDDGTGTLVSIATITTNQEGKVELEVEAEDGLPLGAQTADQLAGRAIEVRDAAGAVVLAGKTPDVRLSGEDRKGATILERPDPAVDPDAEGEIKLIQRDARMTIKVELEHLEPSQAYKITLTNPATNASEALGVITTNGGGHGKLKIDTKKGDAIPFGVGSLSELEGFLVNVADGGDQTVLKGTIAAVAVRPPEPPHEGEREGKSCLAAADPQSTARGEVEIETEDEGEQEFKVEIGGVAPAAVFDVVLTNDAGASDAAGQITTGSRGKGELKLRQGDRLPFDAAGVADLAGLKVEVKDANGNTILSGTVPALDEKASCEDDDDDDEDEDDDEDSPKLEAKTKITDGGEEFEVEIEHLDAGAEYSLVITSADGTKSETIATLNTNEEGKAELELKTENGDPLPLGAASVTELTGLAISVLNAAGETVLSGTVPPPEDKTAGSGSAAGGGGAVVPIDEFLVLGEFDSAFMRGDSNADLTVDIGDAIFSLEFLFLNGDRPLCLDAADSNDDGQLDISDPVASLMYLFAGAGAHPAPGVFIPGFDLSVDDLHCREVAIP
ncbi:MAG: hypothetical protein HY717_08690 [Planctomycetes bacterium]|nr:hypothetical protein [Planctomycetota bacterium]